MDWWEMLPLASSFSSRNENLPDQVTFVLFFLSSSFDDHMPTVATGWNTCVTFPIAMKRCFITIILFFLVFVGKPLYHQDDGH